MLIEDKKYVAEVLAKFAKNTITIDRKEYSLSPDKEYMSDKEIMKRYPYFGNTYLRNVRGRAKTGGDTPLSIDLPCSILYDVSSIDKWINSRKHKSNVLKQVIKKIKNYVQDPSTISEENLISISILNKKYDLPSSFNIYNILRSPNNLGFNEKVKRKVGKAILIKEAAFVKWVLDQE